jgi:two-component system, NarL family, sensor kinase
LKNCRIILHNCIAKGVFYLYSSLLSIVAFHVPFAAFPRISEQDTLQINQWLIKAENFSFTNPDSALGYYNRAKDRSEDIRYTKGLVQAKVGQARVLFGQNITSAISMAKEVVEICEKNDLMGLQASAEALLLLASGYEEAGRSDSSAYYYYLLGQQIESGGDIKPKVAVNLYTKLAIFWLNLYAGSSISDEYQKVLTSYVERAKVAAAQIEEEENAISSTYFLQGAFFHALKQYDSARFYYNEYLKERDALGLIPWQRKASCYVNIAQSYIDENNPAQAIEYLKLAKEVLKSPEAIKYSQYFDSFSDLMLAKAYNQQGKHSESVTLIESTLIRLSGISERINLNIAEAYNTAADSYEAMGNLKQALVYKNLYLTLHDSLIKKEKLDVINGMEVRYRMIEKDKEIAESKLAIAAADEKVRNRNGQIALAVGVICIGGLFTYLWNRKNEHKNRLQRARLDNMERTLEIERLNATISGEEMERNRIARELHDGVGGLLSAAKMNLELFEKKTPLVDKIDLNEGIALLQVASSELRKTAHNLMPEVLLHEGLLKAIQNYCTSLSGKNSPVIQVQVVGVPKPLPAPFEFSVYRIVQELVHNMVRHSRATEGLVELSYREDGGFDLTVEDNGVGLPQKNGGANYDGLGLRNVQQRIKAINGNLDIKASPGNGTSFYIEFNPTPKKVQV